MLWNTRERYGLMTRALHWGIAALFFAQFFLGLGMETWAEDSEALEKQLLNLHTSLGILLAGLVIVRVVLAKLQTQPTPPAHMGPLEVRLAELTKVSLNLLILLTAFSGYLSLAGEGESPMFFGLSMPVPIGESDFLHELGEEAHELLAFIVMGLALFHAAAALKHHFIDKDDVLKRMLGR